MYREPVATNKLKQKSTSQPDPLGPARSAVHRRRTVRQGRYIFNLDLGEFQMIEERRPPESVRAQTSDDESLPPLLEITDIGYVGRQSERMTQHARNLDSPLGVGSTWHRADSRSRSLRHIPTSPNTSSNISRTLPAIPEPSRLRELTPSYRGVTLEQIQSRARRLGRSHPSRVLVQEEIDSLINRRRSHTPEDFSWETLRTTITPDERLPSVHSSFTSTSALSTSGSTRSAATSFPTVETCIVCSALCDSSCSEESGPERE